MTGVLSRIAAVTIAPTKAEVAQMIAELLASRTARRPWTPSGPPSVRSNTTAASRAPAQPTVAIVDSTRISGSSQCVNALGPPIAPTVVRRLAVGREQGDHHGEGGHQYGDTSTRDKSAGHAVPGGAGRGH